MIKAECVAASFHRHRIATFKVTMPRYILAEFNTHRVFSRNSASSRAIPLDKMVKSVQDNPFIPMAWQADHKGMQGTEYIANETGRGGDVSRIEVGWDNAKESAMTQAIWMNDYGLTKQMCNRLLEPFMYHTVLVTSTEWKNFFDLRCPRYEVDLTSMRALGTSTGYGEKKYLKSRKEYEMYLGDPLENNVASIAHNNRTDLDWLKINKGQADIHMMAVAEAIYDAYHEANWKRLKPGEWHIPFGDQIDEQQLITALYSLNNENFLIDNKTLELAKVDIAVARCARLSYQTLGDNPEINYVSDLSLTNKLKKDKHWSPFEHVAYGMNDDQYLTCVKTIINKDGFFEQQHGWLANYRGWVQRRAVLENAA